MDTPEDDVREIMLLCVLQRVWTGALTTKSDYARSMADEVAEAASRGLITTVVVPGRKGWGRTWKLTPNGAVHLFVHAARISDMIVAKDNDESAYRDH